MKKGDTTGSKNDLIEFLYGKLPRATETQIPEGVVKVYGTVQGVGLPINGPLTTLEWKTPRSP